MKRKASRFPIIFTIFIIVFITLTHKPLLKRFYPQKFEALVYKYSSEYNFNPNLIFSVIKVESNFKSSAKSHKDAMGLMQIMPDTGKWIAEQMGISDFSIEELNNPEVNIKMGCWYLDNLRKQFNGNIDLVLASYNGGRGNVTRWLQDSEYSDDGKKLKKIPFNETDKYVRKVKNAFKIYDYVY